MPIFQNISDDEFNYNEDFIVKESKKLNLVIGIFLLIFSIGLFSTGYIGNGGGAMVAAIAALTKSSKTTTVIAINKMGIYYYGELLTDWDHFISEEFIDDVPLPSRRDPGINDQFFLLLKYYKDGLPGYYGRKIQLTDTQNKSEEEIIAAIKFYYKNYEKVNQ
jgi:hypothetical protein